MFGDKTGAMAIKELTQLHDLETYESIETKTMSCEDRNKALTSVNSIQTPSGLFSVYII